MPTGDFIIYVNLIYTDSRHFPLAHSHWPVVAVHAHCQNALFLSNTLASVDLTLIHLYVYPLDWTVCVKHVSLY